VLIPELTGPKEETSQETRHPSCPQHLQHPISLPAPADTTSTDGVNPRRARGQADMPSLKDGFGEEGLL